MSGSHLTLSSPAHTDAGRALWFTTLLVLVSVVGDGWSGRPLGLAHQVLLLPFTLGFAFAVWRLLFRPAAGVGVTLRGSLWLVFLFQALSVALFYYEARHFTALGYQLFPVASTLLCVISLGWLLVLAVMPRPRASAIMVAGVGCYAAGVLLAIASFPLSYLRSDMLPVIVWADTNLMHHISPYATMYVGGRVYDFPYLPGMLVAFLPAVAARLDIRFACLAWNVASAILVFWATARPYRRQVAVLTALFLLSPFLQYRHDLYLQPHWFTLIATFVLMQRRRFVWAAFVCGISMAIYQFSWIVFPFVLLNALRRRSWLEVFKLACASALGAALIAGPFLASATKRIESNTVSQWGRVAHAQADPINLSWWVTFVLPPDKLLRLQAVLMIGLFAWCFFRKRCGTLEDTLRFITLALTVFILFNVLVDGYFYLMLLVVMLAYVCIANAWWQGPRDLASEPATPSPASAA